MAKGKGKEFARLNKPPQEGASPPAVPTGTNPSPPSSAAAAVDPAQVVAARQVVTNSQHPQQTFPPGGQQQLPQALKPNAPPHFKQHLTSAPTQAQKLQAQQQEHAQRQIQAQQRQQQQGGMAVPQSNISSANNNNNIQSKVMLQQSTQRPDYSDARLSTSDIKSTSAKSISQSTTTPVPIIGEKLQKLCNSIDPSYKLDADVQERLLEMADSFVEKVTKDAIKLSKHRGSKSMEVVDVALALKKGYNMSVPGLGPPSVAGNANSGDNVMGGWLFADKVNASSGEDGPASKKQKTG